MSEPTFDAAREERLRWLRVQFILGTPSGKTFDVEEMTTLRDDLDAMLNEIDRLRTALHKAFKLTNIDVRHVTNPGGLLAHVHSVLAPIGIEITAQKNAAKKATRA